MELGWRCFFFMILHICALDPVTGLIVHEGIPTTVTVEEGTAPGTVVANFTIRCANSTSEPHVTLKTMSPTTSFFNNINIVSPDMYQVSLSPSAALDARQVNQYALTISVLCLSESKDMELFIRVIEVSRLECNNGFPPGGEPIKISEDISPGEAIYRIVLKRQGAGSLTFAVEDASMPFTVNDGIVRASPEGFTREQVGKVFSVVIVVTDGGGSSCRVPLNIEVLRVYHNQVNFTEPTIQVSALENSGPWRNVVQVQATGEQVRYQIIHPYTTDFTIDPVTGEIKNTYNLDLQIRPRAAQTLLVVRAYSLLNPTDSDTITVNITVKRQSLRGPICTPAVFVTEIPETTPVGTSLLTLICRGVENASASLDYQIMNNSQRPPYSFRLDGPILQVNTTLDYDSKEMASLSFQYQATILVTDNGTPTRNTTSVPVLVTVSRVNEYPPECSRRVFSVPENAKFGVFIGSINGTDRDYPFDNIEYSILGGVSSVFYIDHHSGNLYVLEHLDYEAQKSYSLTINLKDKDNDINPAVSLTTQCSIIINVQDVNDNPPVCTPPFTEYFIYSTRTTSITELECKDEDELSDLTYKIVGGNINGRFRLNRNILFPNTFSYNPDGVFDPLVFELLVEVTDSRSTPRFSTTATIIVHVTPWTTTVPTTTTTTTTVSKKPIVLFRTVEFWAPDPWFVVVLTLIGALLLSALGLLFWRLWLRKFPGKTSSPPLLQNKDKGLERTIMKEEPGKEKGKGSADVLSLQFQFDGRAQDPVTGQYYLFDSSTGARRWV